MQDVQTKKHNMDANLQGLVRSIVGSAKSMGIQVYNPREEQPVGELAGDGDQ